MFLCWFIWTTLQAFKNYLLIDWLKWENSPPAPKTSPAAFCSEQNGIFLLGLQDLASRLTPLLKPQEQEGSEDFLSNQMAWYFGGDE